MYNTSVDLNSKNPGRTGGEAVDKPGQSIQDTFLNAARKDRSAAKVTRPGLR